MEHNGVCDGHAEPTSQRTDPAGGGAGPGLGLGGGLIPTEQPSGTDVISNYHPCAISCVCDVGAVGVAQTSVVS